VSVSTQYFFSGCRYVYMTSYVCGIRDQTVLLTW